jgi:serine/threonine protein phosphatase 1
LKKKFVIPDLHGCINTLRLVIENVLVPDKNDELYFLGDFINKGPDSKAVVDYVMSLEKGGWNVHAVRGNHEQMLLDALEDKNTLPFFLAKGGYETIRSFNVDKISEIPDHYIEFINELEYYIELDNYYIVHAGFNFNPEDPFEDLDAMMTIRDFRVDPEKIGYKTIIHGHHAKTLEEIREGIVKNNKYIINLDNGCVYRHRAGMGNLVVMDISDHSYVIQPCIDKTT